MTDLSKRKISLKSKTDKNGEYILSDLVLLSLKSGLESFFNVHRSYSPVDSMRDENTGIFKKNHDISNRYLVTYYRTIIHLQHFFELSIKEALMKKKIYLAADFGEDISKIYKMINGKVSEIEFSFKLAAFDSSLRRLTQLNENKIIRSEKVKEFLKSSQALRNLNSLRNDIWHKGTEILEFNDFVVFIIKEILPLINLALKISGRDKKDTHWKYNTLNLKIDPLKELIKEFKNSSVNKYNFWKLYLLLEIGKSAYEKKLPRKKGVQWNVISKLYTTKVLNEFPKSQSNSIKICLVCGLKTLVVSQDDAQGFISSSSFSVESVSYYAKCEFCGFTA